MKEYIERLIDEEIELSIKTSLLADFLQTKTFNGLTEEKQGLLQAQLHIMRAYDNILEMRIEIAKEETKRDNLDRPNRHNIAGPLNRPARDAEWKGKK